MNSYVTGDQLFVYVIKADDASSGYKITQTDDSPNSANAKAMVPLKAILDTCRGMKTPDVAPVAGILLAAAVSWMASEISGEISEYIDTVKKKYSPSPDASTIDLNGLWLNLDSSNHDLNFSCVVVGMAPGKVLKDGKGIDPSQLHFLLVARIEPSTGIQPPAFRIVPLYYMLSMSKAMATPDDDGKSKVKVTVEYAISATSAKETSNVADLILALPAIPLPDCDASDNTCPVQPVDLQSPGSNVVAAGLPTNIEPSPWFSIPHEDGKDAAGQLYCAPKATCMPANLTVTLTEIGNGSPDFDKAHSELTDNAKALADTINKIIDAKTSK
ncbi:hypothetical protein [Paraburkholderia sp. BR10882]|uniref:hypothetical protein n=1 Tax=unclassified Paraburkholderia TaxID=2615204 RepID=UPI0034CEDC37